MKLYTTLLSAFLLLLFNGTLFAKDATASIECLKQQLYLTIKHNNLNLTEEALVDNTGGYVDIPEERHYIKLDQETFKLKGVVLRDNQEHINVFTAPLKNLPAIFITKLTIIKSAKFIQKIDLEENNMIKQSQNITTTNTLTISFDKNISKKEYEKCTKE